MQRLESQGSQEIPKDPKAGAREKVFLAEQAAEVGIKVLPGGSWGLHYSVGAEKRQEILTNALNGQHTADEIVDAIKPDALLYNEEDITSLGLEQVTGRIRDVSAQIAYYNYPRFAQFIEALQGTGATAETAQRLYDGIAQNRIRKSMMDAYGHTGRQQLGEALRQEAEASLTGIAGLPRAEKVLEALKLDWLCDDMGQIEPQIRDQALTQLSGDERLLFDRLKDPYEQFVQKGDPSSYASLVEEIKNTMPVIEALPQEGDEPSKSMQELQEELQEYMDDIGPVGTPKDPAIPPEDEDEYHTQKERQPEGIFFEITPKGTSKAPMVGYYISGHKSYYDQEAMTWSKKKELSPYDTVIEGDRRQTISGTIDAGVKAIPIPGHYALDASSLQYTGSKPELFRDQNGSFYLQSTGKSSFSIDFLEEETPFAAAPIDEDLESLYEGSLSAQTEMTISRLRGNVLEKAEQARQYLLAHHFYPGGGDIKIAQALQHKLRTESTSENYIQNLDASEYLECYSAHALFIAMMRKAGIAARLVMGDHIAKAKDGKAVIDTTTGHAWSEVWDGKDWVRVDATPNPKPEDVKKPQDQDAGEEEEDAETEQANDGGKEKPKDGKGQQKQQGEGSPSDQGEGQQDGQEGQPEGQQPGGSGGPGGLQEATDEEAQQAQSDLNGAKQTVDKAQQLQQTMDKALQDTDSFRDLDSLQKTLEQQADLFDDQKEKLKQKLETKEEQMKDEMKEKLEQMADDGFLDDQRRDELEQRLDETDLTSLDGLKRQIDRESRLFNEYEEIKDEVMSYVDDWYKYFVERLPPEPEIEIDEDSQARSGKFDRRSVMKARNLIFGTVKNPRVFRPSIKPRFLAAIVVDVSRSMGLGRDLQTPDQTKIKSARKLMVFYNELFTRISKEFGYIRYANYVFSDVVTRIKGFDQDYDSSQRYDYENGQSSTVKVRLMEMVRPQSGTNILDTVEEVARELNEQTYDYPEHASAFYFIGDGEDSYHNGPNVRRFLQLTDPDHGFGEHMLSAIMLGDESQRRQLADIFGDEHTTVAGDFDMLVEESMLKFAEDISEYVRNKKIQ